MVAFFHQRQQIVKRRRTLGLKFMILCWVPGHSDCMSLRGAFFATKQSPDLRGDCFGLCPRNDIYKKSPSPQRGRGWVLLAFCCLFDSCLFLWSSLFGCLLRSAVCFGGLDQCADLFVHVKLHVVISAAVLAAGAGAFPATKRLEAGPRTGRRALWTVGICHACLDFVE